MMQRKGESDFLRIPGCLTKLGLRPCLRRRAKRRGRQAIGVLERGMMEYCPRKSSCQNSITPLLHHSPSLACSQTHMASLDASGVA